MPEHHHHRRWLLAPALWAAALPAWAHDSEGILLVGGLMVGGVLLGLLVLVLGLASAVRRRSGPGDARPYDAGSAGRRDPEPPAGGSAGAALVMVGVLLLIGFVVLAIQSGLAGSLLRAFFRH